MKKVLLSIVFVCTFSVLQIRAQQKPNVLILYTDDLGYGDLSCYGATAISTPHIDWLAQNGLRFTDAHCTASTCTPSRFSILQAVMHGAKRGLIFYQAMRI